MLVTDPHTLLPLERVEPAAAIVERIIERIEPLLNRVVRLLDILLGGELDRIVLELLDPTGEEEGAESVDVATERLTTERRRRRQHGSQHTCSHTQICHSCSSGTDRSGRHP
jgi:hypothetical protein